MIQRLKPIFKIHIPVKSIISLMRPPTQLSGRVSVFSVQGERDHQEDRAVHQRMKGSWVPGGEGWLLAVFDGHRGAETAEKACQSLPPAFETSLRAFPGNVPEALRGTFRDLTRRTQNDPSGSTASVIFIPQPADVVYWAVLGDSPVAALDSKGGFHVGPDHNIRTNIRERAAAEARGGIYQDGYLEDSDRPGTGLQMARCLGDRDLARVLSRDPEIGTVPLGGRGIVLVGTDGLLTPGQEPGRDQLSRLMKLIQRGADAQAIVEDARHRQTGDNATAIVWKLF